MSAKKRTKGVKMPIKVGTLVKRYEDGIGHHVCQNLNFVSEEDNSDNHVELDVCLGIIIDVAAVYELGNPEVIVNWVQMCKYHTRQEPLAQMGVHFMNLWEVGQLL